MSSSGLTPIVKKMRKISRWTNKSMRFTFIIGINSFIPWKLPFASTDCMNLAKLKAAIVPSYVHSRLVSTRHQGLICNRAIGNGIVYCCWDHGYPIHVSYRSQGQRISTHLQISLHIDDLNPLHWNRTEIDSEGRETQLECRDQFATDDWHVEWGKSRFRLSPIQFFCCSCCYWMLLGMRFATGNTIVL